MSVADTTLEELIEGFELLGDWESRFGYLLDLGRTLPPMDESDQVEANRVRGCQATVWLVLRTHDGRITISAAVEASALDTSPLTLTSHPASAVGTCSSPVRDSSSSPSPAQPSGHAGRHDLILCGLPLLLSPTEDCGFHLLPLLADLDCCEGPLRPLRYFLPVLQRLGDLGSLSDGE